uniref:Large ribosomal subunit protein uL4c n=1 Tax=Halydictyon mirabile TaxID=189652 RepID=A0A4D6WU04_9FLOR|nr:ribosomal protein L4 [Halydictyon mirabile]
MTNHSYFNINKSPDKQMYIIHRAIKEQLQQRRQGSANTKTKSDVRGGGKKPWKQKEHGRARAGSIRSPLWKGGGVIFGPKPKKYSNKINKKEKKLALKSLLNNKEKQMIIVNQFCNSLIVPNTKLVITELKKLDIQIKLNNILIITEQINQNLYLSARNITKLQLINANNVNLLAIIKSNKIIITSNALKIMQTIYND